MSFGAVSKLASTWALTLVAASVCWGASAQPRRPESAKLEVGGVSFAVPEDFRPLDSAAGESSLFMRHKKYELGVFVAAGTGQADLQQFLLGLLDSSASKLFPKEQQKFEWKPTRREARISRHENGGGASLGYNQRVAILARYHRLSLNGREVWVGFVTEFGKGREAAETFARGLGGGSGPGCNALVELTTSITGEKFSDDDDPCVIVGVMPE